MKEYLLVGLGGVIGALLRYGVMVSAPDTIVLWVENGIGSLILGWLTGRAISSGRKASVLWTTGVLGSFTTFSTFSAAWFVLLQDHFVLAMVYGLGMTLVCFLAAAVGFKLGGELK